MKVESVDVCFLPNTCSEAKEAGVCVSCEFLERCGFGQCLKESYFCTVLFWQQLR